MERTQHLNPQPRAAQKHAALSLSDPVDTDPQADVPELHRRCAQDYGDAQAHRDELDHEDRVHGNESGAPS